MPAFAAFDADHHALTVDVGDLQLEQLASPQAAAVHRHQHRAVIEVLRAGDEPLHLLDAEHRRLQVSN